MSAERAAQVAEPLRGLAETRSAEPFEPDPLGKRETLELVRAYYRIDETRVRKRLFELTKALAKHGWPSADDLDRLTPIAAAGLAGVRRSRLRRM